MKTFFLFTFFLLVSIIGMFFYKKYLMNSQVTAVKTPISHNTPYSLDTPPSESLQGKISSQTGDILWQSRSATESSKLTEQISILQGEEFWTDSKAFLTIVFPQSLEITLKENTHINFIQTLPTSFVIVQDSGEVVYRNPKALPLAIRVLHLLIQKNDGELSIRFDENSKIHITSLKGSTDLAFNNVDNVSTVISLEEREVYVFDDDSKTGIKTSL